MFSSLRRLPGIRSRSNVEVGVLGALLADLVFAVAFTVAAPKAFRHPPDELLEALAGVGGAVFVSYSVSVSALFRRLRRGAESETLLGFIVGLGIGGIFSVGLSLSLIEASKPLGWPGHLAFYWAGISVIFLAALVAALPLFTYENARAEHVNHED